MKAAKTQTVGRSFRINQNSLYTLNKEAENEGISPNALLNKVLKDYCFFYRYLTKYPCITMAQPIFIAVIPKVSEEEAKKFGQAASIRASKDLLKTFGLDHNIDDIRYFIEKILGVYGNWFVYTHHITADKETLHLRHNYGRTWSIFLFEALAPLLEKSYGKKPKADVSDVAVTFEIPVALKVRA
jgi:hypothetical protein